MKSFDGLRAIWAYNWQQQAERTPEAIIVTCRTFGITALQQELVYKMTPQKGGAPIGIPAITAFRDQLAAAGITLIPVFVPGGLPGEAEMHGEIAKLCGCGVVDLEWDSTGDYWSAAPSLIRVYARALRDAAGADCLIGWQPDGRLADDGRAVEWEHVVTSVVPYVDAFWPQLYAGAVSPWNYGGGMETVSKDERRFNRFLALGKPVYPTLFTSDRLWEPEALWARVQGKSNAFAGFRLGATTADGLALMRDLPLTVAPPPVPDPVPVPVPTPVRDPRLDQLVVEVRAWLADDATRAEASTAMRLARITEIMQEVA